MDDANTGLCRPRAEACRIGRSELDAVKPPLRIDEFRFETRHLNERDVIPRLGIALPANQHETIRRDIRVAVSARVNPWEVDPRAVARVRIGERLNLR
jgi:hypothetical protein